MCGGLGKDDCWDHTEPPVVVEQQRGDVSDAGGVGQVRVHGEIVADVKGAPAFEACPRGVRV